MKIALCQVPHPASFGAGLAEVMTGIEQAAQHGARIVCFPECCLKGMRGTGYLLEAITVEEHDRALESVKASAQRHGLNVILPTERPFEGRWQNGAWVIDASGVVLGYQSKNQIPLEEEPFFVPGPSRQVFSLDGVTVGASICHEGWRYPETVRFAAVHGAPLVFHPHFGGGPEGTAAEPIGRWGDTFYEKAMSCRAAENTIWFASVNFAMPVQESRTSLVNPEGDCVASLSPHVPGMLVQEVDLNLATRRLAQRFAPDRYRIV